MSQPRVDRHPLRFLLAVKDIYLRINLIGLILNLPFFSMTVIEPLNRRMSAPSAIKSNCPGACAAKHPSCEDVHAFLGILVAQVSAIAASVQRWSATQHAD
jgi:hypothetical protein